MLRALLLSACFFLTGLQLNAQIKSVYFDWGTLALPQNFDHPTQWPAVRSEEIVGDRYMRLLQCRQLPEAATRMRLEAQGVQFLAYMHQHTYLLSLPVGFRTEALQVLEPTALAVFQPEWKIARNLREKPWGAWAVHGDALDINVQLYPQLSIAEGAELCRQQGWEILKMGNNNGFVKLRVAQSALLEVAAAPFIRTLELATAPSVPDDTRGRSLHRSNVLDADFAGGLHFNGSGVTVQVRDDGPVGPHIDFQGRLYNSNQPGFNPFSHGDGVAGIIGGAGNLNPNQKGMADGADIYTTQYEADFQDATMSLHFDKNVTLTNTSYSNGCNEGYTINAQTVDRQLYENPTLMHVFSAGNSNNSDCDYGAGNQWGNITGGHKMAKNAIATANLNPAGVIETTSSRGPAHDGRLKPDIAANGRDQGSTNENNTYQVFGGTSAAAPGIVGCLAQLTQAYKEQYSGTEPDKTLLKAMILNTANDLGNVGPDFIHGWGHINAMRAYYLLKENRWSSGMVDQGGTATHTLQIPAGVKQANIMIVWLDPPAAIGNTRALINDLDLELVRPGGAISLPWLLDPTPDPVALDAPATRGRDSLNNVEQVSLDDPGAGLYTITIKGTEVPMGPQHYFVVWDFRTDEIKLTYPNGGEGFVPGSVQRLRWDAYGSTTSFTLRYSLDSGNVWLPLGPTQTGEKRQYDWTVPNTLSGKVLVQLIRGSRRDTTDAVLAIAPVPASISFPKVCPDSLTIAWTGSDTLDYQVYMLGEKYMEVKGQTDTTQITIPFANDGKERWVSASAVLEGGISGFRANAVRWEGGLKNCPQAIDLAGLGLSSPNNTSIVACAPQMIPVTIQVANVGQMPVSKGLASYQVNNGPVITDTLPDIAAGETLEYTFNTPLDVSVNGTYNLSLNVAAAGDLVLFNNNIAFSLNALIQPKDTEFTEGFNVENFPPPGWAVVNPDSSFTWRLSQQEGVGPDGATQRLPVLSCYDYDARGQLDYLYMPPLNLSNITEPAVSFYVAHANYSANFSDTLRVEVLPACDLGATPIVVWEKGGADLSTVPATSTDFLPTASTQWRLEVADLSTFSGQEILVRFTTVNDYGNNIYIDDAELSSLTLTPPDAAFSLSTDTVCRLDTVYLQALAADSLDMNFVWSFGANAQPASGTGRGPHLVRYLIGGSKTIRLIATATGGVDTSFQQVQVLNFPVANFTAVTDTTTISFTNTSTNATSYLWKFGDGNTSTEVNPVHTYAAPGTYTVTMDATNECRTLTRTNTYTLTTGIRDLQDQLTLLVQPNPNNGEFLLYLTPQQAMELQAKLSDLSGRVLHQQHIHAAAGQNAIPFKDLKLPDGVYLLHLQGAAGSTVLRVIVQR